MELQDSTVTSSTEEPHRSGPTSQADLPLQCGDVGSSGLFWGIDDYFSELRTMEHWVSLGWSYNRSTPGTSEQESEDDFFEESEEEFSEQDSDEGFSEPESEVESSTEGEIMETEDSSIEDSSTEDEA